MRDDDRHDRDLEALARQLPGDIEPPADLWKRVGARLGEPPPQLSSLETLAQRLPAAIQPPADVWRAVAARLGERPARHSRALASFMPFMSVASVAALVTMAVLMALAQREPGSGAALDSRTAAASLGERAAGAAAPLALGVSDWPDDPEIAPDVANAMRRNLEIVRNDRHAIELAMAAEPDDLRLHELWAHAYETELELNDLWERTAMSYRREQGI